MTALEEATAEVETRAKRSLQSALFVETNGGELEPITDVYRPEGCAIVLWNAVKPLFGDVVRAYLDALDPADVAKRIPVRENAPHLTTLDVLTEVRP